MENGNNANANNGSSNGNGKQKVVWTPPAFKIERIEGTPFVNVVLEQMLPERGSPGDENYRPARPITIRIRDQFVRELLTTGALAALRDWEEAKSFAQAEREMSRHSQFGPATRQTGKTQRERDKRNAKKNGQAQAPAKL